MTKRKLNQQQTARMRKRQQSYCITGQTALSDGLVIVRNGRYALVEDAHGSIVKCAIRPSIASLSAGDLVVWKEEGPLQGVVLSHYPRNTALTRFRAHGSTLVAANVTQMFIVVATQPEISWVFLDRYLILAEYLKIPPIIILSKADIAPYDVQQKLLSVYASIGYPIIFTQYDAPLCENFLQHLAANVSIFVGQSGVGKSSLIARLLPEQSIDILTQELSHIAKLGKHTTRNARYYHLPTGGAVIDSPGVRDMELAPLNFTDIVKGYREFLPYAVNCRYRNCTHSDTPGCAVVAAVTCKAINVERYENFLKISRS